MIARLCTVLLVATALHAGIGAASADTIGRLDDRTCQGTSPNIVDQPYAVSIHAQQQTQPIIHNNVVLYLQEAVTFIAPYQVSGTVSWRNPRTGAHGSRSFTDTVQRYQFLLPLSGPSSYSATIHPGVGPLDVTIYAQPHGMFPVAPVRCTVRFTVI